MNGYYKPVPRYVPAVKDDPEATLRKVVNLVARKDFEDKTVLLDCIAALLARAGYTDAVDAF